jgi:preprotein translocase subunit YajC
MDYTALSDIISNFGFPIAVAVAMFWYVNKQDERHREEMGDMRKTLEENTSVLSGLKDIISVFITKIGD